VEPDTLARARGDRRRGRRSRRPLDRLLRWWKLWRWRRGLLAAAPSSWKAKARSCGPSHFA